MPFRTRTKGSVETTPTTMNRTRFTASTGKFTFADVAYQNGPFNYGQTETMHDIVTSRYHERSSKGEVIVNPMVKTKWELTMVPGGFSFQNNPGTSNDFTDTYDGFYSIDRKGGPNGHLPVDIALRELRVRAGTNAAAAVEEPTFESLTFLAELNETVKFLRNPVEGYVKWLRYMRNVKKSRHPAKHHYRLYDFIADNWLSYRYGVRPLIHDAQSLMKAMNESDRRPKRRTARGFASDQNYDSASYISGTYSANVQVDTQTTRNVKVRAGILYEVTTTLENNKYGTSLSDILPAAWEAIPFSFVADWFANVGPYLRTVVPKIGVRSLGSWTVTEDERITNTTSYIESLDDTNDVILNPGHCTEVLRTTTKSRDPGVDVGLTFKSSNFNLAKLGVDRIDDLSALGRQLLKSTR